MCDSHALQQPSPAPIYQEYVTAHRATSNNIPIRLGHPFPMPPLLAAPRCEAALIIYLQLGDTKLRLLLVKPRTRDPRT